MTIYTERCNETVQNSLYKITCQFMQGLVQALNTYRLKATIRQERLELVAMSDHMLRDIGISREQAIEESKREDIPAARSNTGA